jgi:hypothetical protein
MVFRVVRLAVTAGASVAVLGALPVAAHADSGVAGIPLPTPKVTAPVVLPTALPTVTVPTALPTVTVPTVNPTVLPTLPVPTVPVPTVAVPTVAVPSLPVPSLPVPSVPVPSVPLPSVPLPSLPLPTGLPSLPVDVPGVTPPEVVLPIALPTTLPPLPVDLPVGVPLPPTKGLPSALEGAVVMPPVAGVEGTALDTNGDGVADAVVAMDGTVRRVGPVAPGTATRVVTRAVTGKPGVARAGAESPVGAPVGSSRGMAAWAAAFLVAAMGALHVAALRRPGGLRNG